VLETKSPPAGLRSLQLIVVALFMGVVIFAVIATFAQQGRTPQPSGQLRMVGVGMVAMMVPMALIARHVLSRAKSGLPEDPAETAPDALLQRYFVITILGAALLEGPALFAVVIYLQTQDPVDLLIGAVPTVLIPLACYPTSGRWWRYVRSFDETPPRFGEM
jgi:hypothetical protein